MVGFMIRILWIRFSLDDEKDNKEFFDKFGIFFRDLKNDKISSLYYFLIILRRFTIVFISQIAVNKMIQLIVVISFHLIVRYRQVFLYICFVRCFKTNILSFFHISTEGLVLSYHMIIMYACYKDLLYSEFLFSKISIWIIYCAWGINIIVNSWLMISNVISRLKICKKKIVERDYDNKVVPISNDTKLENVYNIRKNFSISN